MSSAKLIKYSKREYLFFGFWFILYFELLEAMLILSVTRFWTDNCEYIFLYGALKSGKPRILPYVALKGWLFLAYMTKLCSQPVLRAPPKEITGLKDFRVFLPAPRFCSVWIDGGALSLAVLRQRRSHDGRLRFGETSTAFVPCVSSYIHGD